MKTYNVGIIGSTGQGDYGHGLDSAFQKVERARIVAVADDSETGRKQAGRRLGIDRLYGDYREMLRREKPDIVCISPRWITHRVAMVEACAAAGCHIYCEKPFAAGLVSADAMRRACGRAGVKLAIAHQWRAIPPVQRAIRDVRAGKYGKLLRIRARPKDDARGGGEELLVHGTHLLDMMIAFAGRPAWVSGHVQVAGRDATLADKTTATEPLGPIAGDSISAMFGFKGGVRGFFDTTRNLSIRGKSRFDNLYGLFLECERASLALRQPGDVYIYPAPLVLPDLKDLEWEKLWIEDWHFTSEHKPRTDIRRQWVHIGNRTLANDLIDAIETQRDPLSGITNGVLITEIVQGVYASHFAEGRRLSIPLTDRVHPLGTFV